MIWGYGRDVGDRGRGRDCEVGWRGAGRSDDRHCFLVIERRGGVRVCAGEHLASSSPSSSAANILARTYNFVFILVCTRAFESICTCSHSQNL